ncbi:MAG TPA: flagellin-like protein, partial [Kiloniellales bacterium]|nr:flagellin-like protein [Kiloniellales bacterium]
MASEIALSSAARSALLSLKSASDLINRTNNRLSSGLKVASPIDDAKVFFEAKALNDRAADISEKKDGVDQAISSVSAALEAVESIDSLVRQAKG